MATYLRLLTTLVSVCGVITLRAEGPQATKRVPQQATSTERHEATTKGTMLVHVVGPDGQPTPRARIQVSVWTEEKDFKHNQYYACDEKGQVEVLLPRTLEILRVWAAKAGYAPLFVQWWPKEQADGHLIPDEKRFVFFEPRHEPGPLETDEKRRVSWALY